MPPAPSKYAENQFLAATEGSVPLMDELMAYTASRLKAAATADPAFDEALDIFTDAQTAWNQGITALANANAALPAATLALYDRLQSVTRKPDADTNSLAETWDNIIRGAVAYQGPTYLYLLPNGRATFTSGTIEQQVDAYLALSVRLKEQTAKPTLVTLGNTVLAFYNEVKGLRTTQETRATALTQARQTQETLRKACAVALYKVVARAMWIWADDPTQVDSLISLSLLRGPEQTVPLAPVDTTWTPVTRTLSTTALPAGASRVEAWRLAPGGAPEMIATSAPDEAFAVVPETILFTPGVAYQLWLEALNSAGTSPAGPVQVWTAPPAK